MAKNNKFFFWLIVGFLVLWCFGVWIFYLRPSKVSPTAVEPEITKVPRENRAVSEQPQLERWTIQLHGTEVLLRSSHPLPHQLQLWYGDHLVVQHDTPRPELRFNLLKHPFKSRNTLKLVGYHQGKEVKKFVDFNVEAIVDPVTSVQYDREGIAFQLRYYSLKSYLQPQINLEVTGSDTQYLQKPLFTQEIIDDLGHFVRYQVQYYFPFSDKKPSFISLQGQWSFEHQPSMKIYQPISGKID